MASGNWFGWPHGLIHAPSVGPDAETEAKVREEIERISKTMNAAILSGAAYSPPPSRTVDLTDRQRWLYEQTSQMQDYIRALEWEDYSDRQQLLRKRQETLRARAEAERREREDRSRKVADAQRESIRATLRALGDRRAEETLPAWVEDRAKIAVKYALAGQVNEAAACCKAVAVEYHLEKSGPPAAPEPRGESGIRVFED